MQAAILDLLRIVECGLVFNSNITTVSRVERRLRKEPKKDLRYKQATLLI